MYQPLPSTFGAASAILGKKSDREMHGDFKLVRVSDSKVSVKYGLLDIGAYNAPTDKSAGTVEVQPDDARSRVVLSALNQMLAGTGAVIGERTKRELEAREAVAREMGLDPADFAKSGWLLFAPSLKAAPITKRVSLPIL